MKITGVEALEKELKKFANLDDVKNVVKMNGAEMQKSAMKKAPVDTGFLKRWIVLDIEDDGYSARVESTAEYAKYQEYSTRFITGTPHIRPAFYEQEKKFVSDMKRLLK